ncbi:MAG TPA: glutamate 5-kinase [bacterium]|nr:glutamate 5-kinase [bacterium]
MKRIEALRKNKRIVIKIGTQVLTSENNRLDVSVIEHIVEQICYLVKKKKIEVIIVTSGAIGAGMQVLGWKKRPESINRLQAAASIGQSRLMRVYERLFKEEGLNVGQILLTRDVFVSKEREKIARETISTLLKLGVIPVINENDSVAVDEIKFGDNDTLSSLVAILLGADMLVILTDVDGLSKNDPKKDKYSSIIRNVKDFSKISDIVVGEISKQGRGGIQSKISAARHVVDSGICCIILNGKKMWNLKKAVNGENIGTMFYPQNRRDIK